MALYTLHLRTIPRIQANIPSQVSPEDNEVIPLSSTTREMMDARWTNRKLLADLAFVCKSSPEWMKEKAIHLSRLFTSSSLRRTL